MGRIKAILGKAGWGLGLRTLMSLTQGQEKNGRSVWMMSAFMEMKKEFGTNRRNDPERNWGLPE